MSCDRRKPRSTPTGALSLQSSSKIKGRTLRKGKTAHLFLVETCERWTADIRLHYWEPNKCRDQHIKQGLKTEGYFSIKGSKISTNKKSSSNYAKVWHFQFFSGTSLHPLVNKLWKAVVKDEGFLLFFFVNTSTCCGITVHYPWSTRFLVKCSNSIASRSFREIRSCQWKNISQKTLNKTVLWKVESPIRQYVQNDKFRL